MANESRRVYDEYLEALDSTKIQVKTLNNDGSASYKDINSYADFIDAGYALEYKDKIYNTSEEVYVYTSYYGETHYFDNPEIDPEYHGGGHITMIDRYGQTVASVGGGERIILTEKTTLPVSFKELAHDALGVDYSTEPTGKEFEEIITNLINSGDVTIVRIKDNSKTSVAIDTGLQEVSDETLLRRAEAKYEADMRKIDAKDRKYDTDLAALDAERNAIKSEMETLKTVAKDNVERTFKLFS